MNKPSQERIDRAAEGIKGLVGELCVDKIMGIPSKITAKAIAESALTADDSHLAAKLERVMKLLGEAAEALDIADLVFYGKADYANQKITSETLTKIRAEREVEE